MQLLEWDRIVAHKRYANTAEVKADFPSVDFIGQGKAAFNIVGIKYRLVVEMNLQGRGLSNTGLTRAALAPIMVARRVRRSSSPGNEYARVARGVCADLLVKPAASRKRES